MPGDGGRRDKGLTVATPLSADRLLAALRDEGVRVVEHRSWRTRNRNGAGRWGPVHGVMIHHTVTSGTDSSVRLCYEGRSDLPGPLCHGVIAKDGTVYLVGHGRANHAGRGDGDVLAAVIAERPLPPDNETDADGNTHFYGFECVNLGDNKDPWPAAQVEAIVRASAALCRAHGWGEDGDTSVIGHLEWQPGKVDPRGPGISMGDIRRRVAERLDHSAGWSPNDDNEEDPMPAYVNLGRNQPKSIRPGVWDAVEWDVEWSDEPGHHSGTGSQFVRGPARFSGHAWLRIDGLPAGVQVQARLSEVEDGEYVQDHPVCEAVGTQGSTFLVVPLTGSVRGGRGVRLRVKHWHSEAIQVSGVLKAHVLEG